jgi:hypothetical protein
MVGASNRRHRLPEFDTETDRMLALVLAIFPALPS